MGRPHTLSASSIRSRLAPLLAPLVMPVLGLLLTGAANAQTAAPGAAGTRAGPTDTETLFEKAFGHKRAEKVKTLDLPVKLPGREIGQVPARLGSDPAEMEIDLNRLALLLRDFVQPQALVPLQALATPDGFGKVARLPSGGITTTLDTTELSLTVQIPAELRAVRRLAVANRGNEANGYEVLENAEAAAYINMRASQQFAAMPGQTSGPYRQPLQLSFEEGANILGWVVESQAQYLEDYSGHFVRGPTRLMRDDVEDAVRYQIGDLDYPVASSQANPSLAGFSVARDYAIQPYRLTQPGGSRTFILDAPSTIDVLINGRPTRTYREDAGPINLSDFPGASGANDVEVRVTDIYGRTQTIDFPFFYDSDLLAAGLSQFGYTVGVPYAATNTVLRYDRAQPTFSGFHRLGLSDIVTVGANLQANKNQQVAGGEFLYSTAIGTFGIDPGASFGATRGATATLIYRDYDNDARFYEQRTVTAQATWRSPGYASLGTLTPNNVVAYDLALRLGQPLDQDTTMTLNGRYQLNRQVGQGDGFEVDLGMRHRFTRDLTLDVTLTRGRTAPGGLSDTGALVSLRYTFDDGRQSAGSSVDTISHLREVDWRYQDPQPTNAWNMAVNATDGGGSRQGNATIGYVQDRFEASVRHDLTQQTVSTGHQALDNVTTLNAGTALVFADGHVALSRPVTNSFAIVVPHPRLDGKTVGVDPINGDYLAQNDWTGPPVVPNMSAYLVRPLLLDVPDAPLGYDLGNDRPAVAAGNHSGTLIHIGTDAAVSLEGVLLDPAGKPLALLAGELRATGETAGRLRRQAAEHREGRVGQDPAAVPFFTNRKGRFRVEGVRPGQWELTLNGQSFRAVPVTVAQDAEGMLPLGIVRLDPP